jgi:hypothetical protein
VLDRSDVVCMLLDARQVPEGGHLILDLLAMMHPLVVCALVSSMEAAERKAPMLEDT